MFYTIQNEKKMTFLGKLGIILSLSVNNILLLNSNAQN